MTVHAENGACRVTRLGGRWWIEYDGAPARRVTVDEAARMATSWPRDAVTLRLDGGSQFDWLVQARWDAEDRVRAEVVERRRELAGRVEAAAVKKKRDRVRLPAALVAEVIEVLRADG